jgi:hypothetical protein
MAGYSGTPLFKKLGIKQHSRVCLLGLPSEIKQELTDALASCRVVTDRLEALDFAMIFVRTGADLKSNLSRISTRLAPAGMLWVSWPKKASGVSTDLREDLVRGVGLAAGLVDVKVCAVNEVWSGLKFVIPLKDRRARSSSPPMRVKRSS